MPYPHCFWCDRLESLKGIAKGKTVHLQHAKKWSMQVSVCMRLQAGQLQIRLFCDVLALCKGPSIKTG